MRIISGTARGTKLYSLEGMNTRPTLDRIKETLFNIININIQDSYMLDLFSGSGAIGLEAASRGAKKVFLCDKSKEAIKVIRKNLDKTKLNEKCVVVNGDYKKCIEEINEKFDIVFLDPPYNTNYASESVKMIIDKDLLKDEGQIIIETDEEERILEEINNLKIEVFSIRKYGRVKLIFIRKG